MAEDELGLPDYGSDPTTDIFSDDWVGDEAESDAIDETAESRVGDVVDEPAEVEAPVEVDETPEAEAEVEEAPDEDETPAEELPPLIAGRFKTQEEADAYTKTTQAAYTRGQQELAATRREAAATKAQFEAQSQAQNAQMQQMAAQMQQMQAMQMAQLEEINPEQAAQLRAQQEQAQLQARQQQQQQAWQQEQASRVAWEQEQRANAESQATLNAFYARQPEARSQEEAIAQTIRSFAEIGDGWGIDLGEPDALDVAFELTKEPGLREQLIKLDLAPSQRAIEVARQVGNDDRLAAAIRANPAYGATDEALDIARQMLSGPELLQAQDQAKARADAANAKARNAANVEPGNAGTPDDSAPGDDWDALREWEKESASAFGF